MVPGIGRAISGYLIQYMVYDITIAAARVALRFQDCIYVNDLSAEMEWGNDISLPVRRSNSTAFNITVREFIKRVFAGLGIEIEFSGKNEHEKGVIIDVNEDNLPSGLSIDELKFGQTIVRIGHAPPNLMNCELTDAVIEAGKKLAWNPETGLDKLIEELIKKITDRH